MIIGKSNPTSNQGAYQWEYQDVSGTKEIMFAWSDDGSGFGSKTQAYTFTPGVWYHIAVTFSGSGANNRIRFYVNGTQVGSDQAPNQSSIYNSNAAFQIGGHSGTGFDQAYFDGLMDDVRVWSRELSSTEINDLYNDSESFSNGSNLAGWWKFDNDYTDASGNGNTLTATSSPVFSDEVAYGGGAESLATSKTSNESVNNSSTLQTDDDLRLALATNKTYVVDGVIFAAATTSSATPDIILSFTAPSGSVVNLGANDIVLTKDVISPRIALPATSATAIHVHGTVITGGTSGNLQLKWAQSTATASATSVLQGSYLRAEEIAE